MSGSLNEVILNEQIHRIHTGNATDTGIINLITSNNRIAKLTSLVTLTVPAFAATVNTNGVCPVDRTVLNDPMIPAETGDRAALRYRRTH